MKLNEEQIQARMVHLHDQETSGPQTWWWLSYCDPNKEPGSQFLGVIIVKAGGITTAAAEAWRLKISPGGEVMGFDLEHRTPKPGYENRLLTKAEAEVSIPDDPLEAIEFARKEQA